jgi:hypothetical protein
MGFLNDVVPDEATNLALRSAQRKDRGEIPRLARNDKALKVAVFLLLLITLLGSIPCQLSGSAAAPDLAGKAARGGLDAASTGDHKVYWASDFEGRDIAEKVNHAIAAAAPGSTVMVPGGSFLHASPIRIDKTIRLEGAGSAETTFVSTSLTNDQIEIVKGADYSTVANLGLYTQGNLAPTGGAGITVSASFVHLSNLRIWNQYNGVVFDGPQNLYIDDCDIRCLANDLWQRAGVNLAVRRTKLYGSTGPSTGLHLTHGAGIWLNDVEIHGNARGILVDPGPNEGVGQIFAKGVVVDTSHQQDGILIGGSGTVYHISFAESWIGGSENGYGINLNNKLTNGFTWSGGLIRENYLSGVFIQAGENIQILGAQISANGHNNGTGHDTYGVSVAPGVGHFMIADCLIGKTGFDEEGGGTMRQTVGIYIAPGDSDFFEVINNMDTGNTEALLVDNSRGKRKVIQGNLGKVTPE